MDKFSHTNNNVMIIWNKSELLNQVHKHAPTVAHINLCIEKGKHLEVEYKKLDI